MAGSDVTHLLFLPTQDSYLKVEQRELGVESGALLDLLEVGGGGGGGKKG